MVRYIALLVCGAGMQELTGRYSQFESLKLSIYRRFQDTTDILDYVCKPEPQILIGASIGAWIAIMAAMARPNRVRVSQSGFAWRLLSFCFFCQCSSCL